jgi:hypothetical protein
VPVSECFWNQDEGATFSLPTAISSAFSSTSTSYEYDYLAILEPMIQINWKESDRLSSSLQANTTNTHDGSGTQEHSTPAKQTPASQTPATQTPSHQRHHALSKSAMIAIAVVIPVVVIAAFVGALVYFRRWRKKRLEKEKNNIPEIDVSQ